MRAPESRIAALAAALLAVVATACANHGVTSARAEQAGGGDASATTDADPDTTSDADPDTTTGAGAADPFGWEELYPGVETGLLEVPVDYEDPDGPTFELFVARRLADDQANRIGSLLVNPGGPGFGGSDFAIYADQVYDEALLERFDIVGWDPRGTGLSEPAIDCIDDYDRYFASTDITPDDDAERQEIIDLAEEFTDACVTNNEDYFAFVGTNNSARDIDAIRRALGEDEISYFGFSYGSELGATWATLFPDTVRAAVLDGASDPNADGLEGSLQQAAGFEGTLTTYLAGCSADPECAFHNDGDAEGAFDTLMESLDEEPIPSTPGRPDVTRGVALQAVGQAMYSESLWAQLSDALVAAQEGEGAGLLELYDQYFQRQPDGTWGNELEAFQTISCMDDGQRLTIEEEDATAPQFQEVAPRFAPGTTGSYFCTFFPPALDPRVEITGAGAGPIVVIGTTGDAATPLESTRAMAETLEEGRLVVVTADQHTGYNLNDCVNDVVHEYLIDLVDPPAETEC
jgi:pimeloyl-ACP methyl ester carboxylesterase